MPFKKYPADEPFPAEPLILSRRRALLGLALAPPDVEGVLLRAQRALVVAGYGDGARLRPLPPLVGAVGVALALQQRGREAALEQDGRGMAVAGL